MSAKIRSGPSRRGITQWSRKHAGGPRYIEVGADSRVLVIEDSLSRQIQFRAWLGSTAKIVSKVSKAVEALRQEKFDLVFLDRDLGFGEFGEDVARAMVELKFSGRCIVHSDNPFGVEVISKILREAQIQVECVPFALLGLIRERRSQPS